MTSEAQTILPEAEWRERERAHRSFIGPWIDAYRERRSRGRTHPVHDFLFSYYPVNRGRLRRWSPMAAMRLGGSGANVFLEDPRFRRFPEGVGLDPAALPGKERKRLAGIATLLEGALARPPRFGCFGLHEWAMVYRAELIRHETTPLRVPPEEIARLVESIPLCCTHFDAYRFFAPQAIPLNATPLARESQEDNEQFGCVHFNMDLYRWCYKAWPWVGSDLTDECFRLAAAAREFDMRASPYDVRAYGFEPIPIETPEGRERYRQGQLELHRRGQPLARRLLAELRHTLGAAAHI